MKIGYAVTAGAAVVMLCRVVWARQPWQPALANSETENYEYACGALFMMIFPPYFLVYDQTLLAIPLVMLWSSPAWRWGVALLATSTVLAANLSFKLGFSLTGFVALATMFSLAFDFLKNRPTFQLTEQIRFWEGTQAKQFSIPKPAGHRKGEKP